ncbi:hypothetical protein [Tuwongella immobilis]|uniref:Uncharacterized protein n=1 Tax=Tuwongella immobilis TaxID=692036 RepID=A0A6C2YVG6_9BACT|nr:hypothetical protein [Tuwongella immobilis]VIP05163.1 unnamed protein product [Tuwongella immobilis]VTS07682.1 unnamed protein product [Tuwongella immobilis]
MFPIDVYVLSSQRDMETVAVFANKYLGGLVEAAENYPVPQYADAHHVVYNDIISFVKAAIRNPTLRYSLYFRNPVPDTHIHTAMLFFTQDGHLVAGLRLVNGQDHVGFYLNQIADCVNGECGYATVEAPPPLSREGFLTESEQSPFPVFRYSSSS